MKLAFERGDKTLFRGAYHPWTEFRSPADVCGPEVFSDVIDLCHEEDAILSQTPYTGAQETVTALHDNGHKIVYISNRATERTSATMEWLEKWDFPLENQTTQLLCLMEDKKPHIAECQYVIDDRPKTLIDFIYDFEWESHMRTMMRSLKYNEDDEKEYRSKHMRRGFGLMFEHNRALTDIPHIYLAPTWAGLNFYLVGKGLLPEPAVEALA